MSSEFPGFTAPRCFICLSGTGLLPPPGRRISQPKHEIFSSFDSRPLIGRLGIQFKTFVKPWEIEEIMQIGRAKLFMDSTHQTTRNPGLGFS